MSQLEAILMSQDKNLFWSQMDRLKKQYEHYSSIYSRAMYEYYAQRTSDSGSTVEEISFVLARGNEPFLGFLGCKISCDLTTTQICAHEIPSVFLQLASVGKLEKRFTRKYLNTLLGEDSTLVKIREHQQSGRVSLGFEYLMANKKIVSTNIRYTRLIDLKLSLVQLKSNIRKSYSSLINWGFRSLALKVNNSFNISWDTMQEFRELHIQEAGAETRSINTWHMQYMAIKENKAFCITAYLDNALVSAGYFTLADRHCYYGSSASARHLFDKPLFHAVMWKAIVYAKQSGAIAFETGEDYPIQSDDFRPSSKERQIAMFKAGFGGMISLQLDYIFD